MKSATDEQSGKVSVVIPAYNCGQVISRTIESVLSQTRRADEIIVVDDGSSDDTGAIVQKFGSQVRYIQQKSQGASAARNTGIETTSGEWIAFLDGDDEWLPEKLKIQLALLERHPELVWATGNFLRCLCGTNRQAPDIKPAAALQKLAGKEFADSYFLAYARGMGGWTGTMIIKRQALYEAGLFRVEQKRANDLDMWWRIAHRWPSIGYTPEPVAIYHMGHPDTISQGYFDLDLYTELIERHLELADRQNRRQDFEVCAAFMIRRWIRAMLFDKRGDDIRKLMQQFDYLLSGRYKMMMRLLTVYPQLTAGGCHTISRFIRFFNLRRQVTRPPKKQEVDGG